MTNPDAPRDTLRRVFGFEDFREGQGQVVRTLLEGRSTVAIFPTGGGKSLCYQLPALLLDGLTVVVSPLIALMKDQIDFLTRRGVAAARLDSSLGAGEAREILGKLGRGEIKLLYVAPERLANERFLQTLGRLPVDLLAVDEAHCISEWGHNFRPDYMKLARLAVDLKVGRVLALTATATPDVARDIAAAFRVADGDVVRTAFHRPNLTLRVTPTADDRRGATLLERIGSRPRGPTIVYVTLQRTAEDVAAFLAAKGLPAEAYHAGLDAERRHAIQDRFMGSDDAIVVATIAFGMGIDKANIRYVYHYNLPGGLENYAQEIGRAGRDGKASTCEMLAVEADAATLENFTYGDTPTEEAVAAMIDDVLGRGAAFDVSTYELSGEHDIRPLVVETLLTYLELEGVLAATGPFYAEYKFKPRRPSAEILAEFDPERAGFLRRVLSQSKKAKVWFKIDAHAAAEALGEPRSRIVAALNFLEERGDLELEVAGVRQGYRLLRAGPGRGALAATLAGRFRGHEARQVERVGRVLEFARLDGCRTRHLLEYFGDRLDADCGHCDRCLGERTPPLPPRTPRAFGPAEVEAARSLAAEGRAALASPRQRARFLCGLSSPAASRAKLTRDSRFGALSAWPFGRVLELTEERA